MDTGRGSKIRPLERFNFCTQLKSIKKACTELEINEQRYKEKLNNIIRLHGTMLEMMKKYIHIPNEMMVDPDGNTEEFATIRLLQQLIEQNLVLQEQNQRLKKAIKSFKGKFKKLLK